MKIENASSRKDEETIASICIPDLSSFEAQRIELNKKIKASQAAQENTQREIEALQAQPEFAHFLTLQSKIMRGEIKLNPAQL